MSLFLLIFILHADEQERAVTQEESYVDTKHKELSEQVIKWSTYIDKDLDERIRKYQDPDNNTTSSKDINDSTITEDDITSQEVDTFFQNQKFLDETEESFVRVRIEARLNSKDDSKFNLRLKASLALSRSRDNIKFFISGDQDNVKEFLDEEDEAQRRPELGLDFFTPLTERIDSKYSIGISGIYPFTRVRYSMTHKTDLWTIEPVQTFQYSLKDDLKEETQVYIDTPLIDTTLLRIELGRGTESRQKGMDYLGALHLFWTPAPKTGLQLTQAFFGNTKYEYVTDSSEPTETDTYGGINNYLTSLTWRQSIFRKWFFYEVSPGVNYSIVYDYEPNYRFFVKLDFYFGHIK